jgi:hypothetical protein
MFLELESISIQCWEQYKMQGWAERPITAKDEKNFGWYLNCSPHVV